MLAGAATLFSALRGRGHDVNTRWEKRNIAEEIPVWKEELCTQCNHCVAALPTLKVQLREVSFSPQAMKRASQSAFAGREIPRYARPEICAAVAPGRLYRMVCVEVCPAKDRQKSTDQRRLT